MLARRKEEFLKELKELKGPLRDLFVQANVEYNGMLFIPVFFFFFFFLNFQGLFP